MVPLDTNVQCMMSFASNIATNMVSLALTMIFSFWEGADPIKSHCLDYYLLSGVS